MRFSKLMRHSAARFPEYSQTVQDSALYQNVAEECFPSVFGELGDHFDLFCGVEETEAVRPHKETASRVTSDARRGLSPRLETTSTLHPRTASRSSHRPVRSSSDRPARNRPGNRYPSLGADRRGRLNQKCGRCARHVSRRRQWSDCDNESGFRPASCGPLFEYPTGRRQIFATQAAAPGANCGAGGGGRTLIPSEGCGILSPVRLPVPPLRQSSDSFEFTSKLLQAHCSGSCSGSPYHFCRFAAGLLIPCARFPPWLLDPP